ncbi:MAG TPA: hypothetical protein VGX00_07660 [Thermoplasmata archaeon]|nr:hypothetical protein [Thermoplasmata archaeon]
MAVVILLTGLGGMGLSGLGSAPGGFSIGPSVSAHPFHSIGPAAPSHVVPMGHAVTPSTSRPLPSVPRITLTPATGTVGQAVVANGSGFLVSTPSASMAVTVSWAPGGWVLCNVATNASGDFVCGFTIPNGAFGPHLIKATDTAPNTATATFTVTQTASIAPGSGEAGVAASIKATGFTGNSNTSFVWAPTSSLLCKLNTSAFGDLTCNFNVPAAASLGVHQITVTDSSAHNALVNFTVLAVPPSVTVVLTSPFHLYSALPLNLTWAISSSAAVNTQTTTMWILVQDLGSSACPFILFNGLGQGVGVQNTPCTVANLSLSSLIVNGTDAYAYSLTNAEMTSQNYHGGTLPFGTEYSVGVFVGISTAPYVGGVTSGSVGIGGATQDNYLQTYLPQGVLLSPNPNGGISTGNTSVVVSYSGDFVSGAEISIFSSATSQLVYTAGVAVAGSGPHIGTAATAWRPTTAGKYTATLNLSGPYGYTLFNFALNVVPAGTTVYVNTSNYHNESILGGLGAGTTAALLMVVGLIVGLAVALLLGRMMWGPSATKPPTPWSSKPAENGSGKSSLKPNECPVCHQQFASAMELSDHQTKAHGTKT